MTWRRHNTAPHVVLATQRPSAPTTAHATVVAEDKLVAYMETHYSVRTPEVITLRIGEANAALAEAMRRHGVATCAFVTAFNPSGAAIEESENLARHAALLADLAKIGCVSYEGAGGHPDNGWPEERSCLCFGLLFEDACQIGAKWGQDAIVWCDADAVPQLVLLR